MSTIHFILCKRLVFIFLPHNCRLWSITPAETVFPGGFCRDLPEIRWLESRTLKQSSTNAIAVDGENHPKWSVCILYYMYIIYIYVYFICTYIYMYILGFSTCGMIGLIWLNSIESREESL